MQVLRIQWLSHFGKFKHIHTRQINPYTTYPYFLDPIRIEVIAQCEVFQSHIARILQIPGLDLDILFGIGGYMRSREISIPVIFVPGVRDIVPFDVTGIVWEKPGPVTIRRPVIPFSDALKKGCEGPVFVMKIQIDTKTVPGS